ncbi:hypothetical protein JTE90_022533 [Oedothorax gibbosus]|uniref:Uncharacterized protein n=1 Tax=Oedothorax gibbosus TaxID=931172 RepID=A0AAV6TJI6_9ARAC|nr:hypothetical protein JTE90_022533 [Oedothorax gibbosus]
MHHIPRNNFPRWSGTHGGRTTRRELRREGKHARLADPVIHQLNPRSTDTGGGGGECPYLGAETDNMNYPSPGNHCRLSPSAFASARFSPHYGGKNKPSTYNSV